MFDIGWTEIVVIACVAIIVVGPKDLPRVLRTVGKTVGNLRRMAGDFQKQFDDALKEVELDEVKKLANAKVDLDSPVSATSQDTENKDEFDLSWMQTDDPGAIAEEPSTAETKPVEAAASAPAAKKTTAKRAPAKKAAAKGKSTTAAKKPAAKAPAARKSAAKPAAAKSGTAKTPAAGTKARKPAAKRSTGKA